LDAISTSAIPIQTSIIKLQALRLGHPSPTRQQQLHEYGVRGNYYSTHKQVYSRNKFFAIFHSSQMEKSWRNWCTPEQNISEI
jgi:hypothetical protein